MKTKYVCDVCGRVFTDKDACVEHEARCEFDRVPMVKFKFWFTLGPSNINDNFNRRIERREVLFTPEEAKELALEHLDRDVAGGIASFTTTCRLENEKLALERFMYDVEQEITKMMYALRNARLAFIGSIDYIKDKDKKQVEDTNAADNDAPV